MKYSDQMRADAMRSVNSPSGVGETSRGSQAHGRQGVAEVAPASSAVEKRPVTASFVIEKKVGDARVTAYGHTGQEEDARAAVQETAARLRKA